MSPPKSAFTNQQPVAMQSSMVAHSGPLPSADEFRKYNETHPGTAERMLRMVEHQSETRIDNEKKLINLTVTLELWGQWLGFTVTVLSLIAACALAYFDKPIVAIFPGVIGLINILAAFSGRNNK